MDINVAEAILMAVLFILGVVVGKVWRP